MKWKTEWENGAERESQKAAWVATFPLDVVLEIDFQDADDGMANYLGLVDPWRDHLVRNLLAAYLNRKAGTINRHWVQLVNALAAPEMTELDEQIVRWIGDIQQCRGAGLPDTVTAQRVITRSLTRIVSLLDNYASGLVDCIRDLCSKE